MHTHVLIPLKDILERIEQLAPQLGDSDEISIRKQKCILEVQQLVLGSEQVTIKEEHKDIRDERGRRLVQTTRYLLPVKTTHR